MTDMSVLPTEKNQPSDFHPTQVHDGGQAVNVPHELKCTGLGDKAGVQRILD